MSNLDYCSACCKGVTGKHGECCHANGGRWVLGPIVDSEEFVENFNKKFGSNVTHQDIFHTVETAKKEYPKASIQTNPDFHPSFRTDRTKELDPCIFYDTEKKLCKVYDIRPRTCREYTCQFLAEKTGNWPEIEKKNY